MIHRILKKFREKLFKLLFPAYSKKYMELKLNVAALNRQLAEPAQLLAEEGKSLWRSNRLEEAKTCFLAWTKIAPSNPQGYLWLAQAARRSHSPEEALKYLEHVRNNWPNNPGWLEPMVTALRLLGRHGEASRILTEHPIERLDEHSTATLLLQNTLVSEDKIDALLHQYGLQGQTREICKKHLTHKAEIYEKVKRFDYSIVSLGRVCFPASFSSRWGLNSAFIANESKRLPFDLGIHPLDSVLMLLDSDFSGYSDPQNIDIQTRENGNEIFKLKYPHCVFNHDPIYNYDSNVDIFAKILQERVDAFRQALTKNRPILFIHFSDVPLPREALECFKVFLDRNGLQHKLLIIVSDQKNYSLARDGDIFTVYSKLNTKLQTINGKDIAWHQSERRWSPERFEAEREIAEAIVTIISEHFPEKTAGEIIRLEDASEAERKKLVHEVAAEYNVKEYLKELKAKAGLSEADGASRKVGAVVMNCNPFTLGHRHLIERAAAEVDRLIVFVVEEDLSYFKFADRFNLVCESTADLKNVMVVRSGKFIISTVTLPGYFTRDNPDLSKFDASVDLDFFGEYIAPALGVTVRFAGEEPLDKVTKQYNDAMCLMLPRYGVEFAIIPRLESEGEAISASRVRTLLETYDFDAIEKLVPKTTLRYLQEKFMTESPLHSSIGKNPAQ